MPALPGCGTSCSFIVAVVARFAVGNLKAAFSRRLSRKKTRCPFNKQFPVRIPVVAPIAKQLFWLTSGCLEPFSCRAIGGQDRVAHVCTAARSFISGHAFEPMTWGFPNIDAPF